jgi:hypothetical protein
MKYPCRQLLDLFSIMRSPGFPDISFDCEHGVGAGISIGRLSIVLTKRLLHGNRLRESRFWIDNRSSGVEGSLSFTVVANIYRCRPTIGRELLSATCAVNYCLIGDKRRVLTKQAQLLVGQSVAFDLAISAGVFLCR